jgi:hypothetical protein
MGLEELVYMTIHIPVSIIWIQLTITMSEQRVIWYTVV